jgi:hypothetical protein
LENKKANCISVLSDIKQRFINKMDNEARCRPLSWSEARRRLRTCLELYLKEKPSQRHDYPIAVTTIKQTWWIELLRWWVQHDFDVYFGSLPLAMGLLAINCVAYFNRSISIGSGLLRPSANLSVYAVQVAAGTLLLTGSIISLILLQRRRYLSMNDADSVKHREIEKYLRCIDSICTKSKSQEEGGTTGSTKQNEAEGLDTPLDVIGTALKGSYPVCRLQKNTQGVYFAAWTRLPSLLLVHDDLIALQVGDIAPARCISVDAIKSTTPSPLVTLLPGQAITLGCIRQDVTGVLNALPRGRTTLFEGSNDILTVCNKMQLFRIQDAPLNEFLRRQVGKCDF